jgi:hypothetical protein
MAHQIKIKERETEEYALAQPDMLRVEIKTGKIIVDKRDNFDIAKGKK